MLTIGDVLPTLALQGIKPDAVSGKAAFSRAHNFTSVAVPHAAIRLVSASGLSTERDAPAVMPVRDMLQGGRLCHGNWLQSSEHLEAA